MQRFTLIHDGSNQGWQAAYLAFRVAARLGAPLRVLLGDSTDEEMLIQRATQVEIGGRAAGVVIRTRMVADFSLDILVENTSAIDGLFLPRRLVPDEETVARFLEALTCPLWIVSQGPEFNKMAVLVSDLVADEKLIHYTTILSHRLQQPLVGFVQEKELVSAAQSDVEFDWELLQNFSSRAINSTIDQLNIGLFFVSASKTSLINELTSNCIVFPPT
jgi:hypothetical protein